MVRLRNDALALAFGALVKELRAGLGISQEHLAHTAGIDRRTIGRIETGQHQPTLAVLWSIAHAVSLAPHTLVKRLEDAAFKSVLVADDKDPGKES